jgi:hypothetical protein
LHASGKGRHLGCIITQKHFGDFKNPDVTAFVVERDDAGSTDLAATVMAELAPTWDFTATPPQRLVAVQGRSGPSLDGGEFRFEPGHLVWSDHPDALDFPSAFVPVTTPKADGLRDLGLWEQFERADWSTRPGRLPGGWIRHVRRLPIGEHVWFTRELRPGLVETSYVTPDELAGLVLA